MKSLAEQKQTYKKATKIKNKNKKKPTKTNKQTYIPKLKFEPPTRSGQRQGICSVCACK